jgi:hypothetical protein
VQERFGRREAIYLREEPRARTTTHQIVDMLDEERYVSLL